MRDLVLDLQLTFTERLYETIVISHDFYAPFFHECAFKINETSSVAHFIFTYHYHEPSKKKQHAKLALHCLSLRISLQNRSKTISILYCDLKVKNIARIQLRARDSSSQYIRLVMTAKNNPAFEE